MKIYIIIILIFISYDCYSKLVISEVLASNFRGLLDEDNDDSDWIELYNDSNEDINIGGYRISDKDNFEKAFILPDTILKAKERIVIFASGKNRFTSDKYWVETTGMGVAPHLTDEIFHFMYMPVSGNFEAELEICEIINGMDFSGCGLIFKSELDTKSPYATILSNVNRNSYTSLIKLDSKEYPLFNQSNFLYKDFSKIKIELKDSIISTYCIGPDNYSWVLIQQMKTNWGNGYLGIALAATDFQNIRKELFSFKNFKLNGSEVDPYSLTIKDVSNNDLGSRHFKRNEIHTDFKLDKDKDQIYLWNNKSELLVFKEYHEQYTNISYSNENFYCIPSPHKENIFYSSGILKVPKFRIEKEKRKKHIYLYNEVESDTINYIKNKINFDNEVEIYNDKIDLEVNNFIITRNSNLDKKSYSNLFISNVDYKSDNLDKINLTILISDSLKLYQFYEEDEVVRDIELPINFEYESLNGDYITIPCGMQLHGNGSRNLNQKSFQIIFRENYYDRIPDLNFFENINNKKVVLKNGGQDWIKTMLRDQFADVLCKSNFANVLTKKHKIVEVSLNNDFIGIYNFREFIDDDYISELYNINPSSINILKDGYKLINGDASELYKILNNIESIHKDSLYYYFDKSNIFEYSFFRLFSAIEDWPPYNQITWNSKEIDNKWRFTLHDMENSFGLIATSDYNINSYKKLQEKGYFLKNVLYQILKDSLSKQEYLNFIADQLNFNFTKNNTLPIFDSLYNIMKVNVDIQRTKYPESMIYFEESSESLREFLRNRPDYFFQHTAEEFEQSGVSSITFTQNYENAGVFHINSLNITDKEWTGKYFNEIPINVNVSSNPGYRFVGWLNIESIDSVLTNVLPKDIDKFEAIFERTSEVAEPFKKMVVINEIMYKPYEYMDCGDWIELFNNGNRDIDMTNWSFRDENFQHVYNILEGVILKAGEFLIIAQDPMKFRSYYGVAKNVIGGFEFGLGGDDEIRIYNENNQIVDEVKYKNNLPWDEFANGTGYSLELIHPDLDNSLPNNWRASNNYSGSPLAHNTVLNISANKNEIDINVFPNPFNEYVYIENNTSEIYLEIYNILGEKLFNLDNIYSNYNLDLSSYNSGVYYFVFKNSKGELIKTFNIIKN